MIAIGDDLYLAGPARGGLEFLGRITVAVLLVPAYAEHRALHLRRQPDDVRHRHQAVEKALRGDHPPPARHEQEFLAAPGRHQRAGLNSQLFLTITGEELLGSPGYGPHPAAPGG